MPWSIEQGPYVDGAEVTVDEGERARAERLRRRRPDRRRRQDPRRHGQHLHGDEPRRPARRRSTSRSTSTTCTAASTARRLDGQRHERGRRHRHLHRCRDVDRSRELGVGYTLNEVSTTWRERRRVRRSRRHGSCTSEQGADAFTLVSVAGSTSATLTVTELGATVDCDITNTDVAPKLTLEKKVLPARDRARLPRDPLDADGCRRRHGGHLRRGNRDGNRRLERGVHARRDGGLRRRRRVHGLPVELRLHERRGTARARRVQRRGGAGTGSGGLVRDHEHRGPGHVPARQGGRLDRSERRRHLDDRLQDHGHRRERGLGRHVRPQSTRSPTSVRASRSPRRRGPARAGRAGAGWTPRSNPRRSSRTT